jgi:hypothetical protein
MAYWTVEIQSPGDELFSWPAVRVLAVQKGRRTITALVDAESSALDIVRKSPRVLSVTLPPGFSQDTHRAA